jgi:hypothetical protein
MTDRRGLVGLTLAAFGCVPPGPGFTLDEDETGNDDPTGDGDADVDLDGEVDVDEGPNDVPFELELAVLNVTGQFVALRFSEPVAPVDGIDPRDFRISVASEMYLSNGNGDYEYTTYWDANFYADHYAGYYPPEPYSTDRFETDLIAAGNMPTDIVLRFEMPLDPTLCEWLDTTGQSDYVFLFVHYSPGEIPVRSADGEELAPIGPEWVEVPYYAWGTYGHLPNLNPKIPIPCSL